MPDRLALEVADRVVVMNHATPAGAVVRLELEGADGALLQVEMPRDRHEALHPQLGDGLYLRPRQVRVFLDG